VDPETSTQVPEKGISDRDMVLLSERDFGEGSPATALWEKPGEFSKGSTTELGIHT